VALLDRLLGFRSEPDYVRTAANDGRKYIDLDKFLKDDRVRRQLNLKKLTQTNGSPQEDGVSQERSKN
jgi:hypothetical protein